MKNFLAFLFALVASSAFAAEFDIPYNQRRANGTNEAKLLTPTASGMIMTNASKEMIGSTLQNAINLLMGASGSLAQGDVFYFNGTNVVKLAAGTNGHFLKTQGTGANPVWAAGGASTWGSITGTLSDQIDLSAALAAKATVVALTAHVDDMANPHGVTKTQVGLGNVNNTSDADKPISTATQTALDLKVDEGAITSSGLTMATARILGRTTAGTGAIEELTVVPLTLGGTGQASAQAAINALMAASGALAQGDVFYFNGTNVVRLAAGTNGHFLKTQGTGANPVWAAGGSAAWGAITGTLSDQTDLQTALDAKANLSIANAFTAVQSVAVNGAANTPGIKLAGAPFSGGTSTTTKPYFLIEATGATSTNWNTSGTGIGVNFSSAESTSALLIDLQRDGTRTFSVNGSGLVSALGLVSGSDISSGAGGFYQWSTRSVMRSPADGQITMLNAAETDFGRLNLGGTTSSFPAIKRSGATLEARLADDSAYAGSQTLYERFGSGSPESAVAAPVGAIYHRTDGGAGTSFYIKESGAGNTGWALPAGSGDVVAVGTLTNNSLIIGQGTTSVAAATTGTGVLTFLGTPSSANLATAVTDETGSGALVFGTNPLFPTKIRIGEAAGTTGSIELNGTTSGTVTVKPADAAGTWTLTLPTNDGDADQVLKTNGSGVTSWVTPSAGSGGVVTGVELSADRTSTSTSLADVTGLSFAVAANTTYDFEFNIAYTSSASTEGLGLSMNGPASPTSIFYTVYIASATALRDTGYATAYETNFQAINGANSAGQGSARISGRLVNGANAGTLIVRFSTETGGANSSVIKTLSFGRLTTYP